METISIWVDAMCLRYQRLIFMTDNTSVLVSICCVTYNHENYIRQCLEGFVTQKTTFPFEILVHEDASTDNTANLVKEYESKYPDLFRCVYQTENQFAKQNTLINILFPMSRGKYISLCEGDDYWTDPYKLQKQVDFLEANPDFSICFHKAKVIYDEGIQPFYPDINKDTKEVTTIEDIAKGNYIHTPTVVFRNSTISKIPEWFETAFPADWVLHVIGATYGKIKFIKEEMCVYRVHKNGLYSTKRKEHKSSKYLPTIKNVALYLNEKHPACSKNLFKTYEVEYFYSMALRNENEIGRVARSFIFLKSGFKLRSKKIIFFFWLPIFLGNKTEAFWNKF